jgi:hypothetical protein
VTETHEMMLTEFARHYRAPLRDACQPRPQALHSGRVRSLAARLRRVGPTMPDRRLAVLDSMFPWRMSGFRYHEAVTIFEARPDTLFFSTYEMTDSFPAPVHPLADFPEIARREGITDAYGVFLSFLAGLVGLGPSRHGPDPHPVEGLDLSEALAYQGIRMHGTLLPGGGFFATQEGFQLTSAVIERLHTTFSFVDDVLERFPSVVRIPAAFTETRFHATSSDRWATPEPLVCLFAADNPVRKGFDVVLATFSSLTDGSHLHVVGPHEHRRHELPATVATFHGWLDPSRLRDLHRHVHVFLSPVSTEPPGLGQGVTDGFPTQAAADAMSSGCLLVSANPLADHRVFEPGVHYVECPADAEALRDLLRRLARDPNTMRRIAETGSARVRERMDVRLGVSEKLKLMGI